MTPTDLISELSTLGPASLDPNLLHTRLLLCYLADHVHDATLVNGLPVRDVTDVDMWLRELAEACRHVDRARIRHVVSPERPADPCPRCGHAHEGDRECGAQIAKDRFCRCEMEVPA